MSNLKNLKNLYDDLTNSLEYRLYVDSVVKRKKDPITKKYFSPKEYESLKKVIGQRFDTKNEFGYLQNKKFEVSKDAKYLPVYQNFRSSGWDPENQIYFGNVLGVSTLRIPHKDSYEDAKIEVYDKYDFNSFHGGQSYGKSFLKLLNNFRKGNFSHIQAPILRIAERYGAQVLPDEVTAERMGAEPRFVPVSIDIPVSEIMTKEDWNNFKSQISYKDDEDRVKKAKGDEVNYLQANNFQAAIDLLRNPADVGSIEPISGLEVLTSKPITDPVTKNLFAGIKGVKEFFLPEPKFSDPLSLLDYLATATPPGKAAKVTSKGVGSLFSDEAAEFLLRAEKEIKDLSDIKRRRQRVQKKENELVFKSKADDLSDVQKELDILELEAKNLDDQAFKITQKFNKKTSYKFDKFLEPRYIPSLAPKQGKIGKPNVLKVTKAKKDRDILEKTGARFDSPGFDDFYQSSYGASKLLNPRATERILENPEYFSNKFIGPFQGSRPVKVIQEGGQEIQMPLNPLEKLEIDRMSIPTTATIGRGGESFFFADPKKLENLLIRSSSGDDFFKLRKSDPEYLEKLEYNIRRKGYQPNPVQIEVLPSGNISIMEGNHRLFRALKEGEKEIPVEIQYVAGAERLDSALPINNLSRIVADGSKGFKTNKEYATYVQDINKRYRGYGKGDEVKSEIDQDLEDLLSGKGSLADDPLYKLSMMVIGPSGKFKAADIVADFFKHQRIQSLLKSGAPGDITEIKQIQKGLKIKNPAEAEKLYMDLQNKGKELASPEDIQRAIEEFLKK